MFDWNRLLQIAVTQTQTKTQLQLLSHVQFPNAHILTTAVSLTPVVPMSSYASLVKHCATGEPFLLSTHQLPGRQQRQLLLLPQHVPSS